MIGLAWLFVALAAGSLLGGLYLVWQSLRAALGATEPMEVRATAEADTRRRLLERKEALLRNLRDLKFDRDGGKISTADFDALDTKLRSQAKEVLRLLDEDAAPFRQRAEELISEKLVSAGRDPYRAQPADRPDPVDEAPVVADDPEPAAEARVDCPSCETPNDPDAVFCKKCGARVSEPATADDDGAEEGI